MQAETICENGDGSAFCSTQGFCIEFTDTAENDPNASRTFPKIMLLGNSEAVVLEVGAIYATCPDDVDSDQDGDSPCDP